jgi:ATP/maltotriose-dependent transcriptional regulator MalT
MEQVAGLASASPYERAVAQTIAGIEAFTQGDFEPLETGLDDALRIIGEGEDRRIVAFAQLLHAIARGSASDDGRWQAAAVDASRRLQAEGEPLAVGFGLVAGAVIARIHGRMDEARRLAQQAYDISTQVGDSYVRVYALTQLARAALGLGDVAAARKSAVEALVVARRLRNPSQMGYALELWATAELRDGQIERAGQLYALGERGTRLVSDQEVWPTDAEDHWQLVAELRAALGGDRYEELLAQARTVDWESAVDELVKSDPAAQRSSDGGGGAAGEITAASAELDDLSEPPRSAPGTPFPSEVLDRLRRDER